MACFAGFVISVTLCYCCCLHCSPFFINKRYGVIRIVLCPRGAGGSSLSCCHVANEALCRFKFSSARRTHAARFMIQIIWRAENGGELNCSRLGLDLPWGGGQRTTSSRRRDAFVHCGIMSVDTTRFQLTTVSGHVVIAPPMVAFNAHNPSVLFRVSTRPRYHLKKNYSGCSFTEHNGNAA